MACGKQAIERALCVSARPNHCELNQACISASLATRPIVADGKSTQMDAIAKEHRVTAFLSVKLTDLHRQVEAAINIVRQCAAVSQEQALFILGNLRKSR